MTSMKMTTAISPIRMPNFREGMKRESRIVFLMSIIGPRIRKPMVAANGSEESRDLATKASAEEQSERTYAMAIPIPVAAAVLRESVAARELMGTRTRASDAANIPMTRKRPVSRKSCDVCSSTSTIFRRRGALLCMSASQSTHTSLF